MFYNLINVLHLFSTKKKYTLIYIQIGPDFINCFFFASTYFAASPFEMKMNFVLLF